MVPVSQETDSGRLLRDAHAHYGANRRAEAESACAAVLRERGATGPVIVDYKTDTVGDAGALAERATYYKPQLDAYVRALEAATGERARAELVFLDATGGSGRVVSVRGSRPARSGLQPEVSRTAGA